MGVYMGSARIQLEMDKAKISMGKIAVKIISTNNKYGQNIYQRTKIYSILRRIH